ncbi:hypothetical protein A5N82_04515 [Christensenella minuta]|uniref:Uncharacterized protein n=1 Tax=Christensenella minuta TaxID=626937 RepID=A0A136Q4D0_9FIRM|nr:hypothetical protein B1H56_11360 [Christensenella minuta]KXK65510.1 hypothetical protein HMPREF3293_01724 [Christensenella minuta]OAQ42631.1 hypothetical protein A5N82_04515 [Christensenella minuta]
MLGQGREGKQPFIDHIMKTVRQMVPVGTVHSNAGYTVAVVPARLFAGAMVPAGRFHFFS